MRWQMLPCKIMSIADIWPQIEREQRSELYKEL